MKKILLAVMLAASVSGYTRANIVKNGDFNHGNFAEWKNTGNTSFTGVVGGWSNGNFTRYLNGACKRFCVNTAWVLQ